MKEYTYPLFYKLLYRYGNIPLTLFLIIYLVQAVVNIDSNKILIIPLIITMFMIYYLNKQYLTLYNIVPYKIIVTEDKITCLNFFLSKKKLEIHFKDISSLKGGIFAGRKNGVMTVTSINNFTIGFYNSIRSAKELETIILKNAPPEVYNEVAARFNISTGTNSNEAKK